MRSMAIVIIVFAAIALWITGIVVSTQNAISYNNRYEATLDRAQVAAEADTAIYWVQELQANMEESGLTSGYSSLLSHNPHTDMAQTYASVLNVRQRLERANVMDKKSPEYQVALDDCRGIMREINIQSLGWWTYNQGGWVWMYLIALPVMPIIGGIVLGLFCFALPDY